MLDLALAAQMVGGAVRGAARFGDVFTDTRAIVAGGLFVALRGERYDGHDFVCDALEQGASAALVERPWATQHASIAPLIIVDDTRTALAELAASWRAFFRLPLIGVVGSNGKTTVEEMIASILRAAYGEDILATQGNLNNAIGLPLTLLRLREHHRAAVVELGMNHPGETRQLAALLQPTIAVVNNAQREHQEFMHSVQAVAEEHAALIAALPLDGVAVINADDAHAERWRAAAGKRQRIEFGLDAPSAQVRADDLCLHADGARFTLHTGLGELPLQLATLGRHNVRNALAAAAAAIAADVPLAAIAAGLAAFRPVGGRLQKRRGCGGALLIDDSYNANPDSLRASIDVLADFPGRRLLIIGDMAEVGDLSPLYHREIGEYARTQRLDGLFAIGPESAAAARAFGAGGHHFDDPATLIAALRRELTAETTALIKGSRCMQMERIVQALAKDDHAA